MLRKFRLRASDLLNLDLHYETDSFSFNPLRRAYRVRYRACTVRPVDRDCGDRDAIVESRGTSATRSIHSRSNDSIERIHAVIFPHT
jgi:hypothetical protein